MRIAFLSSSGELGGAERSLLDVMASLRAAEPSWSLHLICPAEGPLVREANSLGVAACVLAFPEPLARLGDAGLGGPAGKKVGRVAFLLTALAACGTLGGYVWKLRALLNTLAPDVVHANGFKMQVLAAVAGLRSKRVVWHLHDYVSTRPVMARLLSYFARQCSAVVANSRSVAADAVRVIGSKVPMFVVHNATDLCRFTPCGATLNLDLMSGLPPAEVGIVRVGLVATMGRWKGQQVFLDALSRLPRSLPVRGYIVGGPIYVTNGGQYTVEELRGMATSLGVNDRVGFTGFVEDSAAAMRSLDVVVHASTSPEPFGLVIIEAMACGRAVVASRAGGAAEVFHPGVDSLAHIPGDAAALAECIQSLVTDAGLRTRLGREARAAVERQFDRSRLSAELVPIYQAVCAVHAR